MTKIPQQTLALASLLQTTALVNQLAITGTCASKSSKACLKSIITNSTDIDEVFVDKKDLSIGLNTLKLVLGKRPKSTQSPVAYALALISLEKKLMKNKHLLGELNDELNNIKNQAFFAIDHSNSVAKLSELYKATLGELNPTIMINGKSIYLSNRHIANHIRALLLAGVRAVSLWKSQGGRVWQLFLNHKKILNFANSMDL